MAYTKKKTNVTEPTSNETTKPVGSDNNEPKSTVIQTKKTIPMDALVYVKNLTGGRLIYTSRAMNGYTLIWENYGEELPIEMRELYNMKNTSPKFFKENWVQVDIAVLRDLNVEHYYKDFISYDDIENIAKGNVDKIVKKLNKASAVIRNSIGLRVMDMIEKRELSDINTIRKLEKALGCSLIEDIE